MPIFVESTLKNVHHVLLKSTESVSLSSAANDHRITHEKKKNKNNKSKIEAKKWNARSDDDVIELSYWPELS